MHHALRCFIALFTRTIRIFSLMPKIFLREGLGRR
jgi:hypothetical protein